MTLPRVLTGSGPAALAATFLAAGLAVPAAAAPAVPKGDSFEFTLPTEGVIGSVCDFPVELQGVNGQRTFDNGGVVSSTGPLVVTVTNLENGRSRTFNVSGPTLTDPKTGNLVFVGRTLILQPSTEEPETFLRFVTGRVEQTADNRIDNISGNVLDVCAALS